MDDFKKVNDTLGHEIGDLLLVEVANRLSSCVRQGDTLGRLGGDEFILLVNNMQDVFFGGNIASHLISELEKPFHLQNQELLISASMGIAFYTGDDDQVTDLMRKADLAMYSAKQAGGSCYKLYTSELNDQLGRRFLIEQQLRTALNEDQFYLVYQPKIDLGTGKLNGFEVLLRWQNLILGDISPREFIPVTEQTGAIVNIGYFIIETAFKMLQTLSSLVQHELTLSINLSPRQFRDNNLSKRILLLLDEYNIKPSQIEFEITEGLLIDESPGVKDKLKKLHEKGIGLAMDDFGTGYSSLSYLRRYPFDTLKIDQEFVQNINHDNESAELVRSIISMAHGLGLSVVAEGIETDQQRVLLQQMGCDIGQGYLFSKPVGSERVFELVESFAP